VLAPLVRARVRVLAASAYAVIFVEREITCDEQATSACVTRS
jgi:hypothetical protein